MSVHQLKPFPSSSSQELADGRLRVRSPVPLTKARFALIGYRGTSLTRHRHPVGPYSGTMPRLLWRA